MKNDFCTTTVKTLFSTTLPTLAALALLTGCGDSQPTASADHDDDHMHAPPHGGTPVQLGDEVYHLELVADTTEGKMLAYLYDGHFHDPVLVPETNFVLQARLSGGTESLSFARLPDPATGQVPPKSALFGTRADWLKTNPPFEGTLPLVTLGGRSFTNVTFPYPKGTIHAH
ncbi:MAG: hypothetical protein AB7O66_23400 [Limisphaerales bacterium]